MPRRTRTEENASGCFRRGEDLFAATILPAIYKLNCKCERGMRESAWAHTGRVHYALRRYLHACCTPTRTLRDAARAYYFSSSSTSPSSSSSSLPSNNIPPILLRLISSFKSVSLQSNFPNNASSSRTACYTSVRASCISLFSPQRCFYASFQS